MAASSSFNEVGHYRHLAQMERDHAAEIRAGRVQHLPLDSQWIEHHAGLCERNAARFEAMADQAQAAERRAA